MYEMIFYMQPSFPCNATLVDYKCSDLHTSSYTHSYTYNRKHKTYRTKYAYMTIWDCENYGRLVSIKEEVFRHSGKIDVVLLLKKFGNDVRIVGAKESL